MNIYKVSYLVSNNLSDISAPREGTVLDFWRMIWEKDCGQIVMLTNHMEAGKVCTRRITY